MDKFEKLLNEHWGYKSFRPLQKEIIEEAYKGNDVLGLLPTGGGKSIIFQVAGLARGGLTLVITPLIALMKDQVENLEKKGIPAAALYTGLTYEEIKFYLDEAINDRIKFLYISPERLHSESFKSYLKNMNVTLIAVDEAHCISQWGYDFRPSYLKIAEIRQFFPDIPVIAVTATATPDVVDDIQEKLLFKQKNVLRKSFERKNLIYIVRRIENKYGYLVKTIKKTKGTGIVYVRSRKKTKEIAELLVEQGISADYYHAGLKQETRNKKQEDWKNDKTRIIVATNAFGMGIDKPDVRFVIHIDVPESIEAYFQEAGRAGRDGKKSFAVLLYNNSDKVRLKQFLSKSFPEKKFIKQVYQYLTDYYQLPLGEGKDKVFEFDFYDFVKKYNLPSIETFNSLKILMQEGYINLSDAIFTPSRIKILVNNYELYKFQLEHENLAPVIKALTRTYSGLFTTYVKINEKYLAKKYNTTEENIIKHLRILKKFHIINYIEASDSPKIAFIEPHLEAKHLVISKENFEERKERLQKKIEAIINYAENTTKCRSQQLVEYFGQKKSYRCGECDVCRSRNELDMSKYEFDIILEKIKEILKKDHVPLAQLVDEIDFEENKTIKVIDWLFETGKIKYDEKKFLMWHD
jgi:ATP-dependent DNA helicase RecQ